MKFDKSLRRQHFWQKVDKSGDCWEWTGALDSGGYGQVGWSDGKVWKAHRAVWTLAHGTIPDDMHVLHHCDNPACVNPAHLWLGTHAENMADMARKGRRKGINSGPDNGRAKLTREQANEIRLLYKTSGRSQQSIADQFGISQHAVSKIVRGLRYG